MGYPGYPHISCRGGLLVPGNSKGADATFEAGGGARLEHGAVKKDSKDRLNITDFRNNMDVIWLVVTGT